MARKKISPPRQSRGFTPNAIGFRASKEWMAWLEILKVRCGEQTLPGIIERALADLAEAKGLPVPPPRIPPRGRGS